MIMSMDQPRTSLTKIIIMSGREGCIKLRIRISINFIGSNLLL